MHLRSRDEGWCFRIVIQLKGDTREPSGSWYMASRLSCGTEVDLHQDGVGFEHGAVPGVRRKMDDHAWLQRYCSGLAFQITASLQNVHELFMRVTVPVGHGSGLDRHHFQGCAVAGYELAAYAVSNFGLYVVPGVDRHARHRKLRYFDRILNDVGRPFHVVRAGCQRIPRASSAT